MNDLLLDRVAVVTGSNRGIGKSILEKFAKNKAEVFACARKQNDEFEKYCSEISTKYKTKVHTIYFDLNNSEEIKNAINKIKNLTNKVNILVNNAGIIHTSLFQMTKIEDLKKVFNINFFSPFLFSQYIVKLMIKNKTQSSIVNISSSAAIEANVGRSAYSASKSALIILSKVMSKELSSFNIRVNAIAPGLTKTEMMTSSTDEKYLKETINRTSLKRIAEPNEISNSVLFLASDQSSYINGQVISVDGGLHE